MGVKDYGIQCPLCQGTMKVVDSRDYLMSVRRRRACNDCGFRISTVELVVAKKNEQGGSLKKEVKRWYQRRRVVKMKTKRVREAGQ